MATLLVAPHGTDPRLLSRGTVIGERYRVKDVIGRGGFGTVYEAMHMGTGKSLAVKVLHGSGDLGSMRRFFFEARAMARLEDPATVQVSDFGQDDAGFVYLAMELLRGKTLRQELGDRRALGKAFSAEEAAVIALGILQSLREAHAQGLIHRDLKPENVFLHVRGTAEATVKVCDFGIAKRLGSAMTSGNQALGTPEYMSPEQAQVSAAVDGRSDLYALGVILFELLAGHVPYQADVPLQVMMAHVQAPTPRLSDRTDPRVSALVAQAMAKAPVDRFVDADAMRQAVLDAVPAAAAAKIELVARRVEGLPTPAPSADALTQPMPPREAQTSLGTTLVVTPPPVVPRAGSASLIAFAAIGAVGVAVLAWALAPWQPAPAPAPAPVATVAQPPTLAAPSTATVAARPVSHSPTPEPTHRTALRLIVAPPDARIEVDGRPVTDPSTVEGDERSEHLVSISSPGFRPWTKRVEWTPGRTLTVRLEPVPKQTALPFRSER